MLWLSYSFYHKIFSQMFGIRYHDILNGKIIVFRRFVNCQSFSQYIYIYIYALKNHYIFWLLEITKIENTNKIQKSKDELYNYTQPVSRMWVWNNIYIYIYTYIKHEDHRTDQVSLVHLCRHFIRYREIRLSVHISSCHRKNTCVKLQCGIRLQPHYNHADRPPQHEQHCIVLQSITSIHTEYKIKLKVKNPGERLMLFDKVEYFSFSFDMMTWFGV